MVATIGGIVLLDEVASLRLVIAGTTILTGVAIALVVRLRPARL